MNPRLLELYNQELLHIRESAQEFAREYPKIAGRLTLSGMECADPYVERLLEGFAYLTARVQLKLDAEYPTFTHNLLEVAYPHYLAPTPAMLIAQFQPMPGDANLAAGQLLPRGSALRQAGASAPVDCAARARVGDRRLRRDQPVGQPLDALLMDGVDPGAVATKPELQPATGGELRLETITFTGFAIDDADPLTVDVNANKLEIGLPSMTGEVKVGAIRVGGAAASSIGSLALSNIDMGGTTIKVWGH